MSFIQDDHSDDITNATSLVLGAKTSGRIDIASDEDYFKVDLVAGQRYLFTIDASQLNSINTGYLKLYNINGSSIQNAYTDHNTDIGEFSYIAEKSGTYYLSASEFGDDSTGNYSVKVEQVTIQDDHSEPTPELDQDTVDDFVSRFYTEVLGREYDQSGLDSWSQALENGSKTADDIAMGFFNSQEFLNKNVSNAEFVTIAYETLLGREADTGGYTSWFNQLNGGLARDTLLDGFIYSQEFENLADNYGIEIEILSIQTPPVE